MGVVNGQIPVVIQHDTVIRKTALLKKRKKQEGQSKSECESDENDKD